MMPWRLQVNNPFTAYASIGDREDIYNLVEDEMTDRLRLNNDEKILILEQKVKDLENQVKKLEGNN